VRSDAGLTLIEVLVAALLIGVALLPLMQLYPQIMEADQDVETSMRVGTAAGRKMEELLHRLRADITAVTSGTEACSDLPSCRVEWTITTGASSGTPGVGSLRTITVTSCVDGNGNAACETAELPVHYDAKVTSRP